MVDYNHCKALNEQEELGPHLEDMSAEDFDDIIRMLQVKIKDLIANGCQKRCHERPSPTLNILTDLIQDVMRPSESLMI